MLFRASEVVFFEKQLVEGFLCDSHHSQTTMVGKSESFNELFKNSAASQFCREFTSKNAKKLDFVNGDCIEEDGYEEDATNACPQFSKTFFWEVSRKSLSSAVWLWIAILEASERNCLNQTFFGPKLVGGVRVNLTQSLKDFMKETDEQRWDNFLSYIFE